MTPLRGPLKALVTAELRRAAPEAAAVASCWEKIAADVAGGATPPLDVPPPVQPRTGLLWLALTVIGVGAIAAGVIAGRGGEEGRGVVERDVSRDMLGAGEEAVRGVHEDVSRDMSWAGEGAVREVQEDVSRDMSGAGEAVRLMEGSEVASGGGAPPEDDAPAAAPGRARRASEPEAVPKDTFMAELGLIAQGQAALNRGATDEALRVADLYRRTYPRGHFKEDGEALRALASCAAGRGDEVARRFVRARPRSIHVTRVREACGLPVAEEE